MRKSAKSKDAKPSSELSRLRRENAALKVALEEATRKYYELLDITKGRRAT